MSGPRRHAQRGSALIFALIALVSLMLASVALVRSTDTASQILGNIGFQQDATATAEQATRQATEWLTSGADLTVSSTATSVTSQNTGFYASAADTLDVTGQQSSAATRTLVDWDGNGCATAKAGTFASCSIKPKLLAAINQNDARYVIFRLCRNAGALSTTNCIYPISATSQGSADKGGGGGYPDDPTLTKTTGQYFRIVVRVVGARGTTSFTETIVQY